MQIESTKRFSDRVENYVKYRPGYPPEVIGFLFQECGLNQNSAVADIGSGTGILTALLLEKNLKVFAIEPNDAMQEAAIHSLSNNQNFIPLNGKAEATSLPDNSVDLIVCAQAFHWFNNAETRLEFRRILKNEAYAALIWNNRLANADDFSIAYENLLKKHTKEYNEVNHRNINESDLNTLFRNGQYKTACYPNMQVFDLEGLKGRAFSSSYIPAEGSEEGEEFMKLLEAIFDQFNSAGKVYFHYQTEVYFGKL